MMAAWLYEHPRARRAWLMAQLLWGGWLLALLTAPPASAASAGAAELSWTGLHDSYGVPIGAHLVSTVPLLEALREQGPDFGLTPDSWGPALAAKSATALTYTGLAGMLAFESAALAFICAIGIWFVKFALSTTWLGWLAAAARPILASINAMVSWMQLEVGMGLICVAIGAVVAVVKGVGRGLGIMFGGVIVIILTAWLLRDPIGTEVGDNGVLGIGRTIGFRLSQGFANNGSVSSGGITSQLDKLTSWLVDVLVREQVEQINFGRVIDDIPGCASIYSGALMSPSSVNPAHAVGTCAPDALAHAQQLSGGTAGLFGLLILVICVVLFALCYVGAEVVRVGFKAFFHLVAIVPAAPFAIPPGPPREFVKRTAVKLVVHGVETLIATVGLGVLVILMANTTRGTLPGAIGMTHPVAKLVVMLLVGVFGAVGFRYLLRGLFGDRGLPGPVRIAKGVSGQSGRAESALGGARNVGRRAGATGEWLSSHTKKNQGEAGGEADPKAPARKAHPTPGTERGAAERRPPTAPSGESARPTPSGPGRGPGSGAGARPSPNGSRTASAAKTAVKVGVQAAAVAAAPEGAAAKVAVSAAAKHAPQIARAAGRRRARRAQADGNGKPRREKPPARTAARAPAEQQTPPAAPSRRPPSDTKSTDTSAKPDVKQPQRPERQAPPPGRSGPAKGHLDG